jgi:hypothetical protein
MLHVSQDERPLTRATKPAIARLVRAIFTVVEGENMPDKSITKTGKVAIALAIIAGLLALSRALYNYTQNGKWDIGKIALGIGIPCLMYAIIKSAASRTPEG